MLLAMPSSSEMSSFTCSTTSALPFQFCVRLRLCLSDSSARVSPASEAAGRDSLACREAPPLPSRGPTDFCACNVISIRWRSFVN